MLLARTICLCALLLTTPAPWYANYQRGVEAALRSDWPSVAESMTLAISQQPQESDRYHPHYYMGFANLKMGNYAKAVSELERATGAGDVFLGPLARAYGKIFINYHPYYYRGYANLKLERYNDAIRDFEQTIGPGELSFGTVIELIQEAKAAVD